ncbi:MAG: peptide deformylase [Lachnospiraceae bacterium]|nr:peptide deformylase [Agathobacter sp.]MDD6444350.1 peptide deformylase [Lachnospiraceae bacterium]MDY4893229.1 peptide deformylase [Agathobacter sp.]
MALRTIRIQGDPVLTKVCRPIPEVTERIRILVEDMLETMYEANGVGLAAPQVGILKRLVVIDIGDGQGPFIMINPEIVESSGEQTGDEGCLSLPGKAGTVTRPNYVKAKYYDLDMNECEVVGEELLARAICHELDHLDGHMYVELVEDGLHDVTYEESEE